MVMGIEPADYDIATSARPDEVIALFPRTEPVGAKFGVILVIHRGHPFEVATFRSDDAYVDGRRPTGVTFTGPEEDVQRRDFTINGLLYDPITGQVIDYVDGRADIARKVVRAIGDPDRRFGEDKLRILRAIRFGARLGYTIEEKTWAAVCAMASEITQVSYERIRDELMRILTDQPVDGLRMLDASGLIKVILPEVEWGPRLEAAMAQLHALRPNPPADFALAVLLHACTPGQTIAVASRLRLSNSEADHVRRVVTGQSRIAGAGSLPIAAVKRLARQPRFEDHLDLARIRIAVDHVPADGLEFLSDHLAVWAPADLKPPALISGADLISLGMTPGPSFKTILTAVEDEQLEGRLSDPASALEFVRTRYL
jgi:poly(A) polymerase